MRSLQRLAHSLKLRRQPSATSFLHNKIADREDHQSASTSGRAFGSVRCLLLAEHNRLPGQLLLRAGNDCLSPSTYEQRLMIQADLTGNRFVFAGARPHCRRHRKDTSSFRAGAAARGYARPAGLGD